MPEQDFDHAQFLADLRAMVIEDLRTAPESQEFEQLCDDHREQAVLTLACALWAAGLRDDERRSIAILGDARGPFVPDYWADRTWPPADPHNVLSDFDDWCKRRHVLHQLEPFGDD